jgi:hypothetical protein
MVVSMWMTPSQARLMVLELSKVCPSFTAPLELMRNMKEFRRSWKVSNATVERLYQLEKEHGFTPDAPAHPETREFAVQRLAEGAEMLRAVWWAAWRESEGVAARRRGGGLSP